MTYQAGTDQEAIALGDNFLSQIVPEIEASQAFKDNGVIVIWNDETEGDEDVGSTDGFDGTEIVISPLAKGNAYTNDILYTHASDLVTLQNVFKVAGGGPGGYLGDAAGANSLEDLFKPGVIPSAIPEPSTWVMMGLGFAGLACGAGIAGSLGSSLRLRADAASLTRQHRIGAGRGPAPFLLSSRNRHRTEIDRAAVGETGIIAGRVYGVRPLAADYGSRPARRTGTNCR